MVGFYNYTVWMTYVALASGVAGIFSAFKDHPLVAVICLSVSGILDLFDGKIAKTKKDRTDDEKRYGIQIDSLTDLVCFGVLPPCIGYSLGMHHWAFIVVMIFFVVAGMIRLAYYNVLEEHRQDNGGKPGFVGVPITTSSMTVPLIYILSFFIKSGFEYVYAAYLLILGLLYIVKIHLPKPTVKGSIIFCSILVILYTVGLILVLTLCK